jgi:repressor LexA
MASRSELPKTHQKVLDFIKRFSATQGFSPSYSDIQKALDISRGSVQNSIAWLKKHAYIAGAAGKARAIVLLKEETLRCGIPLLGEISAGFLSEPLQDNEMLDLNLDPQRHFALRVSGDSMVGAGIHNGMTALFQRVPDGYEPSSGRIVAAWVEGEGTTLKHFYREGQQVILRAANPAYPAQEIDTTKQLLRIDGVWFGTLAEGV